MGHLFSTEEEFTEAQDVIGAFLYKAMREAGAVPNIRVVHPLHINGCDDPLSGPSIQGQLQQLQKDIGNRAPTYLRDLISRLSAFSDEPRVAGLVGSVVMMVIDMVYTSSKPPSAKSTGSSARQRVCELQELMEEYLKRCRMNLNDKSKLQQDTSRVEAQLSLNLTQLKSCLLKGDCDSRSLRDWASGATFHTQMLVNLAVLEGQIEPLAARAVSRQYREDLEQILPIYRKYKAGTVSVTKTRGSLTCEASADLLEEGAMTGLTVTDREVGVSLTIPLCDLEKEIGQRLDAAASKTAINPDLFSSNHYAQAYLHHYFSDQGPVAKIETYFTKVSEALGTLQTYPQKSSSKSGHEGQPPLPDHAEGGEPRTEDEWVKCEASGATQREQSPEGSPNESLKLSIVETQHQDQRYSS